MKYRRFGKTELKMPIFTCGGMRFQESWEDHSLDSIPQEHQLAVNKLIKDMYNIGVIHFETARGYGSSEVQLGEALAQLPRDKILIQTKVAPDADPNKFLTNLETSFLNLKIDYADLIAIHGINDEEYYNIMMPCLEILEEWKEKGKIKHIGFSSHGSCGIIEKIIATKRFDYVNLHYFYIYQENFKAIEAAHVEDMGVFIISPNDKGGKLYDPPIKLTGLTDPLSPMQFNDLFCFSNPNIHTLSIGVTKIEDIHEHIGILDYVTEGGVKDDVEKNIALKLDTEMERVLGQEWLDASINNLPYFKDVPNEINIKIIIWLYNLAKGLNLKEYAKMRYNLLGDGGAWFPGNKAENIAKYADEIVKLCELRKHPDSDAVLVALEEAHELLNNEK